MCLAMLWEMASRATCKHATKCGLYTETSHSCTHGGSTECGKYRTLEAKQ